VDSMRALGTVYPAKYFRVLQVKDVADGATIRLGLATVVPGDSVTYEAAFLDSVSRVQVDNETEPRIFRLTELPFAVFVSWEGARHKAITHDDAKRENIATTEFESVMRTDEKPPVRVAW
jgi:hypothetical protein